MAAAEGVTVDAAGSGIVPSKYPSTSCTSAARVIIILNISQFFPLNLSFSGKMVSHSEMSDMFQSYLGLSNDFVKVMLILYEGALNL